MSRPTVVARAYHLIVSVPFRPSPFFFFRFLILGQLVEKKKNQRGPMSPRLFLGAMTSSFNVFVRVLVAMDGRE